MIILASSGTKINGRILMSVLSAWENSKSKTSSRLSPVISDMSSTLLALRNGFRIKELKALKHSAPFAEFK